MKNGVFWMLRRVALVRTDVSLELGASINRVTRIGELGTLPILVTLMMEAQSSSENVCSYKNHTA
jgi:hypothetical protein